MVHVVTYKDHTLEVRIQYPIVTGVLKLSEVLYKPFHIIHCINIVKSGAELEHLIKHIIVFKNRLPIYNITKAPHTNFDI